MQKQDGPPPSKGFIMNQTAIYDYCTHEATRVVQKRYKRSELRVKSLLSFATQIKSSGFISTACHT